GGAQAGPASAGGRSDSLRGGALPCVAVPVRAAGAAVGPLLAALSGLGAARRLGNPYPARCPWFCPVALSQAEGQPSLLNCGDDERAAEVLQLQRTRPFQRGFSGQRNTGFVADGVPGSGVGVTSTGPKRATLPALASEPWSRPRLTHVRSQVRK